MTKPEDIFTDRRRQHRRSRLAGVDNNMACRRRVKDRRRHQCASDREAWWLKIDYVDKRFARKGQ